MKRQLPAEQLSEGLPLVKLLNRGCEGVLGNVFWLPSTASQLLLRRIAREHASALPAGAGVRAIRSHQATSSPVQYLMTRFCSYTDVIAQAKAKTHTT